MVFVYEYIMNIYENIQSFVISVWNILITHTASSKAVLGTGRSLYLIIVNDSSRNVWSKGSARCFPLITQLLWEDRDGWWTPTKDTHTNIYWWNNAQAIVISMRMLLQRMNTQWWITVNDWGGHDGRCSAELKRVLHCLWVSLCLFMILQFWISVEGRSSQNEYISRKLETSENAAQSLVNIQ